jgi:hypothetical protein
MHARKHLFIMHCLNITIRITYQHSLTYIVCRASMCGIALPKPSRVSLDVANFLRCVLKPGFPRKGPISKYPYAGYALKNLVYSFHDDCLAKGKHT